MVIFINNFSFFITRGMMEFSEYKEMMLDTIVSACSHYRNLVEEHSSQMITIRHGLIGMQMRIQEASDLNSMYRGLRDYEPRKDTALDGCVKPVESVKDTLLKHVMAYSIPSPDELRYRFR